MKKYDVIIIWAWLSWCVLWYILRMQNKKVLIFEKQLLKKKKKLCWWIITEKTIKLLNEIFWEKEVFDLWINKYFNWVIHYDKRSLDIYVSWIYTMLRRNIDDFVLNKYLDVWWEIIDNISYEKLIFDSNIIIAAGEKYKYISLVWADWVLSKVRYDLLGSFQKRNFALEVECDLQNNKDINIFFLKKFKWYAWILDNPNNTVTWIWNIKWNQNVKDYFLDFLREKNIKINEENIKWAFLPFGDDIYLNYKNIFFVWDAAWLISPITWEGIYYAVKSAQILSQNMNKNYKKKMKPLVNTINRDLFFSKFVYNESFRNYIFSKYEKNKFITILIKKFANKIL